MPKKPKYAIAEDLQTIFYSMDPYWRNSDLADKTGVSYQTLNRYLIGKHPFPLDDALKILEVVGLLDRKHRGIKHLLKLRSASINIEDAINILVENKLDFPTNEGISLLKNLQDHYDFVKVNGLQPAPPPMPRAIVYATNCPHIDREARTNGMCGSCYVMSLEASNKGPGKIAARRARKKRKKTTEN